MFGAVPVAGINGAVVVVVVVVVIVVMAVVMAGEAHDLQKASGR